jgi:signal transduction histidine kinase
MELGRYYLEENNYLLAHENLLLAQERIIDSKNPELIAQNLSYLGDCNRYLNNFNFSHEQLTESLELRQQNKDTYGIAESYIKLGALHKDMGRYTLAKNWLLKGLEIAELINSNRMMRECYDLLFYVSTDLEDFESANFYKTRFASISEQIYSEASERKFLEMQAKLDIINREQELNQLMQDFESQKMELQKGRILNIGMIIILVLLLTIGGITYYSYQEKKKINLVLQETNKKVVLQNRELKDLNITKDKFFSIIGHDLKTPINSLTAFSELLAKDAGNMSKDELKTISGELNKSLKTLHALLENLLTWARSQTNRIELKPVRFNLNETILDSIQLLGKTAENKEISIHYKPVNNLQVLADKNAIRTVLRNLLSNAIKFTNRAGKVHITIDEYKDAFEVNIKDSGIGMTRDQMDKVFDISAKISTPGTEKEKGTGLGLILCKEFVEKNGGRIMVESKQYEGSIFRFTVPKA